MIDKLKIKIIYDDFIRNVDLTQEEKSIIDLLLKKEKIVKIAMELGLSERTVNYEVKKIKSLFEKYRNSQVLKIIMLLG